jgi:transglutaminase-like putative cysteine protease
LTFSREIADIGVLTSPNQKLLRSEGNVAEVLVSRHPLGETQISEEERRTFLKPDRYIQSNHPSIRAVADSISAATGKSGFALAREIARWVNGYIAEKGFGQGFASALDVMDARNGDCTEHSVLLAAVLRAAGLPARLAAGLAYGGGVLVGHMWTEVYVDHWRTLDALDLRTTPVRIRVTVSEDERALMGTDVINTYSLLGGLEAKVVDYRPAGDD